MKTQKQEFIEDVETLLEKAILEEATQAVWQAFEKAMGTLDDQSRSVLEKHLEGIASEEICGDKEITPAELHNWLGKVKKQVTENLRREIKVKQ